MASTGLKEYVIKINGVDTSFKDITKLEQAVKSLDSTMEANNRTVAVVTRVTTAKAKALTDEEKAAKKLEDTQKRINNVNSEANKAQIAANRELRERTREVTRQIAQSQLLEGSIASMGMSLTDLRLEYENLSAVQRNDQEVGGALLKQIQSLDAEYKALRESTGNFRDSVGNYGRAIEGLDKLKVNITSAREATVGLAADFLGTENAANLFGKAADENSDTVQTFERILVLATAAQGLYTAATQEGLIADGLSASITGIRIVQTRALAAAQALATRGTIAATIAQGLFNVVAAANPYVLLALALVSVVGALVAFTSSADNAADKQRQLNELQEIYLDQLDREVEKLKTVGAERIKAAERALELLQAQGDVIRETGESEESFAKRRAARLAEVRNAENRLYNERVKNNAAQRGFYGNEIANLDENRKKVDQLREVIHQLNLERQKGETVMIIDIDLDGNVDTVKIEDALETVQKRVDLLGRQIEIGVTLTDEQADLAQQAAVMRERRLAEDRATAQALKDQRITAAKEARALELEALRVGEDARIALIKSGYERERQTLIVANRRTIEDIKLRLREEKNLTAAARAAMNATIVSLQEQVKRQLEQLDLQYFDRSLSIQRATEDSRLLLLRDSLERQRQEIENNYTRQREDLRTQLEREEDLTVEERENIVEQVINLEKAKNLEIARINAQAAQDEADRSLDIVESQLAFVTNRVKDIIARDRDGMELIDVERTKANVAAVNNALSQYIKGVQRYQQELSDAHTGTLETLEQGTPEYEAEVKKYSDAMEAATLRIIDAQKQQRDNTKISTKVQMDYYRELAAKITEYVQVAAEVVTGFTDTFSMGLQFAIENLNEQLDQINERYDEAKEQREKAVENVEQLEQRMQNASGGTAAALKAQLQDAMHARQEAEREEQRLAKEKEKREAEIRKKERQQRRLDLIGGIAQGIANTAQSVTKALTLMWPLNLVVAALVGAAGAAQVGIMTRQLTKLAKGGKLKGASHADGGIPISIKGKVAYEAEGGEQVVNKASTEANEPLLNMINAKQGAVSLGEIMGLYDGEDVPTVDETITRNMDDLVLDAIRAINFRPVVTVEDINDGQRRVAEVKELSGFN